MLPGFPPSVLQIAVIKVSAAPSTFLASGLLGLFRLDPICDQLSPTSRLGEYCDPTTTYWLAMLTNGMLPAASYCCIILCSFEVGVCSVTWPYRSVSSTLTKEMY